MAGYWNQPDETASAFRGGRFHTGDIGLIDEQGYLKLVDRKKDMILTGGFNVFPSAVEAALRQHPAVLDTVVVGATNTYMGQLVKAFLEPCPGVGPCDDDELVDFLSERLAPHEIPMIFEWLDKFPQTKIGKIDRKSLQNS